MLLPFTRVIKKSPKKRTNLKPPVLKIISEKPTYWGARCEYGRVAITTSDKLVRITTVRGKKSSVYHITCKYDKHGNFRVYYSCSKGVQDITYKYPYTCESYIHALLTKITNTRTNKLLPTITKEYFSRFVRIFGSGGLTYENI
ncbi:unnamed protein product, partial [marine sediment metagenome]